MAGATIGCGSADAPQKSSERSAKTPPARSGTADSCALFSQSKLAEVVGNPVLKGEPFAGPKVCTWKTEDPAHVSLLLTVRLKGSLRERILCGELRKGSGGAERVEGLGEIASRKFSSAIRLFNSGELEARGDKRKPDEPALKQAALAIARKAFERL